MGKLDTCLEGIKQVRAQAAPWNLVDSQREQLKQLLKGSKAKFQVHVITADRNASLLGMDLFSVLSDSGWDPGKTGLIPDFTLNPALVGIYIVVTHKDFPEAALLQSALHSSVNAIIHSNHNRSRRSGRTMRYGLTLLS
ncbi:MAG: hypothetical protein ABSA33_03755 [Candidatus Micrarchaeaceae archaeon]